MSLYVGLISLLVVFAHSSISLSFHLFGPPLAFVAFAKPAMAFAQKPLKIDTHHHFVPDFYAKGKFKTSVELFCPPT